MSNVMGAIERFLERTVIIGATVFVGISAVRFYNGPQPISNDIHKPSVCAASHFDGKPVQLTGTCALSYEGSVFLTEGECAVKATPDGYESHTNAFRLHRVNTRVSDNTFQSALKERESDIITLEGVVDGNELQLYAAKVDGKTYCLVENCNVLPSEDIPNTYPSLLAQPEYTSQERR